jgi:hypothetical protein
MTSEQDHLTQIKIQTLLNEINSYNIKVIKYYNISSIMRNPIIETELIRKRDSLLVSVSKFNSKLTNKVLLLSLKNIF